jgi:hypothetical protein
MKKIVVLVAIVSAVIFASCEVTLAASISGSVIDQISSGPLVEGGYVNLYKKHGKDDYRWVDGKDILNGEQYYYFDDLKAGTYYVSAGGNDYITAGTESFKVRTNESFEVTTIGLEPLKHFLFDLTLSKWSVPTTGGSVTLTGKFRNNTSSQANLTIFIGSEFWYEEVHEYLYGNPDLGTIQIQAAANDDTIFTTKIIIPADAPHDTCIYPSAYAGLTKWKPKAGVKNIGCITKTYE